MTLPLLHALYWLKCLSLSLALFFTRFCPFYFGWREWLSTIGYSLTWIVWLHFSLSSLTSRVSAFQLNLKGAASPASPKAKVSQCEYRVQEEKREKERERERERVEREKEIEEWAKYRFLQASVRRRQESKKKREKGFKVTFTRL